MSEENQTKTLIKICEVAADVRGLGTDIKWIKENLINTSRILDMHDKRLLKVEEDILIIKERRSMIFKIGRFLLGIIGLKI